MMSFLAIVYIETKSNDTEKYKKYAKNDMTMLVKFRLQNQMIAHTIGIHFWQFKNAKYPMINCLVGRVIFSDKVL